MAPLLRSSAVRRALTWLTATVFVLGAGVFAYIQHPLAVFSVESYFAPPMSDTDVALLRRTLVTLVEALDRVNATYFMTSGTLLGSYRHHGHIPWDDDLDLMISRADKPRVYAALQQYQPQYLMYMRGTPDDDLHWKFFSKDGSKVPFRPYRWPFIDVLFFKADDKFVWNESPWFLDERWPRSSVFPLVRRPFDGLWLPAPCDTAAVLAVNFRINQCVSRDRTHSYDIPFVTSIVVPCDSLKARFVFVERSSISSSVTTKTTLTAGGDRRERGKLSRRARYTEDVESLMIGNELINTVTVRSVCQAI
jgi:hypothetical protein